MLIWLFVNLVISENPFNPFNPWLKSYPQPVIARHEAIKRKGRLDGKLLVDNYMNLNTLFGDKCAI
ncbi:hypothetical protein MCEGE10_02753 [Flavobacteriaceae bacterium]